MALDTRIEGRLRGLERKLSEAQHEVANLRQELSGVVRPTWDTAEWRRYVNQLHDTDVAGGRVHVDDWKRIGAKNGYAARSMGGFFGGNPAVMRTEGEEKVLTDHGRAVLAMWRPRFGIAPP